MAVRWFDLWWVSKINSKCFYLPLDHQELWESSMPLCSWSTLFYCIASIWMYHFPFSWCTDNLEMTASGLLCWMLSLQVQPLPLTVTSSLTLLINVFLWMLFCLVSHKWVLLQWCSTWGDNSSFYLVSYIYLNMPFNNPWIIAIDIDADVEMRGWISCILQKFSLSVELENLIAYRAVLIANIENR